MEKVTQNIMNVGVNDREITLFEGQYVLEKGMAYNSYVILDEKVAIMDTVDPRVTEEWLKNLDEVLGTRKADYLIIQHMEPDHGGSISRIIERFPDMQLVGNAKTFQMLKQFFDVDTEGKEVVVKEGDTLSLERTLCNFLWHRWFTGLRLWLHMSRRKKCFLVLMDSGSLERVMQMKTGHARREDTILISVVNMEFRCRLY